MSEGRTSVIGGEASARGLFGGRRNRARGIAVSIAAVFGGFLTLSLGDARLVGFAIMLGLIGLAWLGTAGTHNGSIAQRAITRARWKDTDKTGQRNFVPFNEPVWTAMSDAYFGAADKENKASVWRDMVAMREWPDGIIGMQWLQEEYGKPGIAWHRPPGEEAYLSVVFSTNGQIAGMESNSYLDYSAQAFGEVLNKLGAAGSLVRRVQSVTRLMAIDSARHEHWIRDNLDAAAPDEFQESYEEVIAELRDNQVGQRHMFAFVWPTNGDFLARADRYGEDRDGWIALMNQEIARVLSALRTAGFLDVKILSAKKVSAVLRHMQHPDFPIDRVVDIDTLSDAWMPSSMDYSYVTTYGAPKLHDPGHVTSWLTRTARISAPNLNVAARGSLWLVPLLTGLGLQIVRTIAFHIELIPQQDARDQAEQDTVSDLTDMRTRARKGQLVDQTTSTELAGAQIRARDLGPGKSHQGAAWVGYITISARTRDELMHAVDAIEAAAGGQPAIRSLEWLDTQQAAAAANTWPVGRGIKASKRLASARARDLLAGNGSKEEL